MKQIYYPRSPRADKYGYVGHTGYCCLIPASKEAAKVMKQKGCPICVKK